jgi:hypothetical protein
MVVFDDTGGKPLAGYGSGSNSGSPVATPRQTAELFRAEATALVDDFNRMCRGGVGRFAGGFCQSVVGESLELRRHASVVAGAPSLRKAVGTVVVVMWVGDRGSEVAKGAQRSASLLGSGLREGSSTAGRYLPVAGRAARTLAPLAKVTPALAVMSVVIALPGGKATSRALAQVAGGAAGAAAGAVVCGGAAVASLGPGAGSCLVLVPLGGGIGSYGAGWLFTKAAG